MPLADCCNRLSGGRPAIGADGDMRLHGLNISGFGIQAIAAGSCRQASFEP
jgi:hypothetical protein